ncbi:MAG: 3-methyl-2-oxobutanoate dehydrogenase subunit VorB [Verrucomicrobia bacterium]|nr:3-methyl-2-oxobutanoate dehydrogenase subunit VorB [Verrucomicrobiota bacterium]MBU4247058.1 3-methyl-2-oxobutanoate dehydrogenase subunit VorB [Verrucomicrobiota bacterium]MBU4291132.1 3-methyl-2-oxobutanoate dehydrogenase subunit VorB [Verrucomicrobiota bacterium]MBU4498169.1 3-methyl-2-oxobutanoate dehydrogenase subunit VorB [Verrucomicrobiota bacterium]
MSPRVLMMGNEAVGEGAIRAGCQCYFGYPITPQNELTAYMAKHMLEHGRVFIQSESELAAISMVFGAAAAGARAMTSSSSPGISLKQEGISYLAGARLPAVIVNVQRGGPGLGGIDPSQCDYFQAVKGGGHGDYHCIVLAPASVQDMHDMTVEAFRLADRYRTPVMVLADGRLGQMMEPITLYAAPPPPVPAKPWALTGATKREARNIRSLFMAEGGLEKHNIILQEVYQQIKRTEPRSEEILTENCDYAIAAWGTCARIAKEVIQKARAQGLRAGLFRPITLWPFPSESLLALAGKVKALLVVEMNAGQMLEDVQLAVKDRVPVHFSGYPGGRVPTTSNMLSALTLMAQQFRGL